MELEETPIPGAFVLHPRVHGDERGFFIESWNARSMAALGLDVAFVQDNHSRSARGVLRGLHFQQPQPQGKLVRVVAGAVWDVIVDLRRSSPAFGQWFGVELSAANHRQLWAPPGVAHGFLTLADGTDFLYKCSAFYAAEHEHTLAWDDPAIGIEWPLAGVAPQLSAKDRAGLPLAQVPVFG